jgi:hypothetical protein
MQLTGMAVLLTLALAGCASTGWPASANPSGMSGTPDRFLVVDAATGNTSEPSGPACRSPMADPRDGARLTLVRSSGGFGDYQLDGLRYGLTANELLRLDCSNGQAVGVTTAPRP